MNADYIVLETELFLFDKPLKAEILYMFKEDEMYACLVLHRGKEEVLKKEIGKGQLGNPFFLIMYKRITAKWDTITIEYVRIAEAPPIRVQVSPDLDVLSS